MYNPNPEEFENNRRFRRIGRVSRQVTLQVGGFATSTIVLSVLALLMIPAMIAAGGSEQWSIIALGQGAGAIAMSFVGWGWWIDGPARVSHADNASRAAEYRASAAARSMLFVVSLPPTFGFSYILAPQNPGAFFLGAVLSSSIGLTASWYFAGVQQPYILLATETLPRALGTAAAILYLIHGGNIYIGVVMQLAGVVAGFLTTTLWIGWRSRLEAASSTVAEHPNVLRVLWERRLGLQVSILTVTYRAMPIVLVGWLTPSALPPFALMDKIGLQINTGIQPIIAAIQGLVPRVSTNRRRLRASLFASAVVAVTGGFALYLLFPALTQLLGVGKIHPDSGLITVFCIFISLAFLDTTLFKAFLPAIGEVRVASTASAASLALGVPATLAGVALWGATGAMAGVAAGLLLKIAIESVTVLRA